MKYTILYVLLCNILTVNIAVSSTVDRDEQSGSWLQLYSMYVQALYVDAYAFKNREPIKPDDVVVFLKENIDREQLFSVNNYVVHYGTKDISSAGCMTFVDRTSVLGVIEKYPRGKCAKVLLKALDEIPEKFEQCEKHEYKFGNQHNLFVSEDLTDVRCLVRPSTVSVLSVNSEFNQIGVIGWGIPAYLDLHSNQIFKCTGYGASLEYRTKKVSATTYSYKFKSLLKKEEPLWSNQYLIKTAGFNYCWGATRIIDEPEYSRGQFHLNDGTVLIAGNVSVLRIRTIDGSTNASSKQVRKVTPKYSHELLDKYDTKMCKGEYLLSDRCALAKLAGYKKSPATSSKLENKKSFYAYVIEGVDKVLQTIFK